MEKNKSFNFLKTIWDQHNLFLKQNKPYRLGIIFVFHIFGAIILTYLVLIVLIYVGFLGELSSSGLYWLWQKLASFFLPTVILFLSIFVAVLLNPVYALVALISVFFGTALFLLSMNVNFLAMIYLIIYIGAIAILFLFVIMMFNLRELRQQSTKMNDYSFLSISFFFYFLVLWKFYSLILDQTVTYVEYDKFIRDFSQHNLENLQYFLTYQHVDSLLFGTLLYEYYSSLFIVAGILLLTSMLGSIVLALSTTETTMDSKS